MRSLRLVPYWSVHETLGVDAHNAPLKMRTRRIHLSRAVAWSCVRRHPVAGAALGSTDVEGSDPPVRGPGTGSDAGVFSHPAPVPSGSLPANYPYAGRRFERRCEAADGDRSARPGLDPVGKQGTPSTAPCRRSKRPVRRCATLPLRSRERRPEAVRARPLLYVELRRSAIRNCFLPTRLHQTRAC